MNLYYKISGILSFERLISLEEMPFKIHVILLILNLITFFSFKPDEKVLFITELK